jgi:hypothetical protein
VQTVRQSKRIYLIIAGLVAVILIPISVYYYNYSVYNSASHSSVNGTTVQIASVRRNVEHFFSCAACSIVSVTCPKTGFGKTAQLHC